METIYIVKGLLIGLSIAAPAGPIGVLCVRRTLANGPGAGFISGAAAATTNAVYGCIAGSGLTFIAAFFIREQFWLRLIGGMFLLYLGIATFHAKPIAGGTSADLKSGVAAYVFDLLIDSYESANHPLVACWGSLATLGGLRLAQSGEPLSPSQGPQRDADTLVRS
jgi:threonine/homoserine/homoserine lactone efflux protein